MTTFVLVPGMNRGPSPMGFHADRARADDGFVVHRWDTRHTVMHDGPERVLELLLSLT